MNIFIKTIVDATPVLLLCLSLIAVANLIVFVGTYDDRKYAPTPKKKLAWDLVRDTRYLDLG